MISPWLLGFQDSQAMTIDVVIGMSVAFMAALEAWLCLRVAVEGPNSEA
jgi:SPW repeat